MSKPALHCTLASDTCAEPLLPPIGTAAGTFSATVPTAISYLASNSSLSVPIVLWTSPRHVLVCHASHDAFMLPPCPQLEPAGVDCGSTTTFECSGWQSTHMHVRLHFKKNTSSPKNFKIVKESIKQSMWLFISTGFCATRQITGQ